MAFSVCLFRATGYPRGGHLMIFVAFLASLFPAAFFAIVWFLRKTAENIQQCMQ